MSDPSILKYINDSRAEGVLDNDIRAALGSSGWDIVSIDKAFQDIDIQKKRASVFSPKQVSSIANIGQDPFRGGSVASHAPVVAPKDDPNFPKIPEIMPPGVNPQPAATSGSAEAVSTQGGGVIPQIMPAKGGGAVDPVPAQIREVKPQVPEYRVIGESGLLSTSSRGPLLQSEQSKQNLSAGGDTGLELKSPDAGAWGNPGTAGSSSKSKLIATISSILFLLIAGSAAAGWYYYTDPNRALSAMPGNMALVKSFEYQLRLKFKFAIDAGNNLIRKENEGGETVFGSGRFSRASVLSALNGILFAVHEELHQADLAQAPSIPQALPSGLADAEFEVRASGVFDRSAEEGDPDFSTQFDMSVKEKAGTIGLGAEFRSIGDTYYFRLVEIPLPILSPALSLTPFSSLDITRYIKNWYSLKRDTVSGLKLTADAGNIDELRRDEQAQKLQELMGRSNLFTIISVARGEQLQNSAVYHYELGPDKIGILNFMTGLIEIQGDRRLTKAEEESLNGFIGGLVKTKLDAWIDKNSRRLLKFNMSMPDYDIGGIGLDAEVTLDLSNFDTAKVPLPERFIPFDDELKNIIAGTITGSLDAAREKSRDSRRIADIKQLQLALELYYDANDNRYPAELKVLAPKFIPLVPSDPSTHKPYFYASHSSFQTYHLGATLEEGDSSALNSDKDCNSRTGAGCENLRGYAHSFDGTDSKGCDGEVGMACFDVVP